MGLQEKFEDFPSAHYLKGIVECYKTQEEIAEELRAENILTNIQIEITRLAKNNQTYYRPELQRDVVMHAEMRKIVDEHKYIFAKHLKSELEKMGYIVTVDNFDPYTLYEISWA